jgi:outer membrane protein assembly factor BamD
MSTHHTQRPLLLAALLLMVNVFGCSWLPGQVDPTAGWSASRFYNEAKEALQEGNYQTAIEYFEKLQARYPFGRYAQQAQLELIYAYYKDNEPDSAIAAADRFIKTFPRHPFVDYAYYMKGLINYSRDASVINRVVPNDPAKTDPGTAKQAFDDFAELVRKFPQSTYAEDARQRMVFLHNNLAAYEINVADYYMRRGAYVAAANRAKYVLENYARTEAVPDALAVMTRAYVKLGLQDLAADSLRVLQVNYPASPHIPELVALLNGEEIPSSSFSLFGLSL